MRKHLPMQQYDGNWYFLRPEPEEQIGEEDLACLLPLTEEYAGQLWTRYISLKQRSRHLMLQQRDDWLSSELRRANEEGRRRYFPTRPGQDAATTREWAEALRALAPYRDDDVIYFFWMRERAVETFWAVFLRHWSHFFYDDEGCILINPSSPTALVFSNDCLFVVQRPPEVTLT